MAALDELRKQQYLKSLSRNPSGVLDPEYQGGKSIQPNEQVVTNPPMDIEGELNKPVQEASVTADSPANIPASQAISTDIGSTPRQIKNGANASGDLMVGASHALLALLSGNYNRAAMEYGKGDQYLEARHKEDTVNNSKLVKTMSPDGKPIYTPNVEAADMEAYVPPVKAGANGAANSFQAGQIRGSDGVLRQGTFNTRTGEFTDKNGVVKMLADGEVFKPFSDKIVQSPTIGGGRSFDKASVYSPGLSNLAVTPGRGDIIKSTPQAYDSMIKSGKKAQDLIYPVQKDLNEMQSIKTDSNTLSDPAVFASSYGALMRATVGEKRLSDDEQDKFEGGKYKSLLQTGYNAMDGKINGKIPQDVINNFKAMLASTMMKKQADLKAIQGTYLNPGSIPTAQGRNQQLVAAGQDPAAVARTSKIAQASFIQAQSIANAKVKSGAWTQLMADKFLNEQRQKLGL